MLEIEKILSVLEYKGFENDPLNFGEQTFALMDGENGVEFAHWGYSDDLMPSFADLLLEYEDIRIADEERKRVVKLRAERAREYIEKLSPEGDFYTSVGDTLDAIIKALYGDFAELDKIAVIISDIKQKHK